MKPKPPPAPSVPTCKHLWLYSPIWVAAFPHVGERICTECRVIEQGEHIQASTPKSIREFNLLVWNWNQLTKPFPKELPK